MPLGLLALLPTGTVHASDPIGKAVRAVQSVVIGKGMLASGDNIFMGDEFNVGRFGTLTLEFNDASTLILTPESRARIVPIGKQKHRGMRMPSFVVQVNGSYRWMTEQAVSLGSIEHIDNPTIFTPPSNEFEVSISRSSQPKPPEPAADIPPVTAENETPPVDSENAEPKASPVNQGAPKVEPARTVKKKPVPATPKPAAPNVVKKAPKPVPKKPAPAPPKPAVTETAHESVPKADPVPVNNKPPTTTTGSPTLPAATKEEPANENRAATQQRSEDPAETPATPQPDANRIPASAATPAPKPTPEPENNVTPAPDETGGDAPVPANTPVEEAPVPGSASDEATADVPTEGANAPSGEVSQPGGTDN